MLPFIERVSGVLLKLRDRLAIVLNSGEAIWRQNDTLYRIVNASKAVLVGILIFYLAADTFLEVDSFPRSVGLVLFALISGIMVFWYLGRGAAVRMLIIVAYSVASPWIVHPGSQIHDTIFVVLIPALLALVLDGWAMILIGPAIAYVSVLIHHGNGLEANSFDTAIAAAMLIFMVVGRWVTDMVIVSMNSGLRKLGEAEELAEELIAELADNVPDGLALYTKNQTGDIEVTFWNKAIGELGGVEWTPGRTLPLAAIKDLADEQALNAIRGYVNRALSGESFVAPERFTKYTKKPNGIWVSTKWVPYRVNDQIKGVLEILQDVSENRGLRDTILERNRELVDAYDRTLEGWVAALDMRDNETRGHSDRVVLQTVRLARAAGFDEGRIAYVRRGALLHDIGKLAVPDSILKKQDSLSPVEWEIMRQHPLHALDFLRGVEFLRPSLSIPVQHHERWNGTGYPYGLKGEQIALEARLFSIVDVFDALTSDRPYRKALPVDEALRYLSENSGRFFCPYGVDLFIRSRPWEEERIP